MSKRRVEMNNAHIRKIDILDLILFNLRHYKGIILAIVVGILLSGGYRLNEFRIALNNEEYVNNAEKIEQIRVSCVLYIDGKEYSNTAAERVTDMGALIKSRDLVETAMKNAGVNIEYEKVYQWIYSTVVGNNMIEVAVDLTAVSGSTIEQAELMLSGMVDELVKLISNFEEPTFVTVVEDVHKGAYHLEQKLSTDEGEQGVDKISELIGVAKYCVLGAAAGFAVAVLYLCVFYLLSTVLRTEEDVCYGLGNVIIGKMFGKDKESMRKAKTAIVHGQDRMTVNLISMTDKEDRSAAVDGLAAALAVNDKKAVVINAAKTKEISAKKGIGEYIAGKCRLEDIISKGEQYDRIERLDGQENMDIFAHNAFAKLMELLKEKYDYVVVDSPAYKTCADGILISEVCDKTVVIAGRNCVKEEDAMDLKKNLAANNVDYAGIILTK